MLYCCNPVVSIQEFGSGCAKERFFLENALEGKDCRCLSYLCAKSQAVDVSSYFVI